VVVLGSGMYGAYCAEKVYRQVSSRTSVLVLEGLAHSSFRNTSRILHAGLDPAGPVTADPGVRGRVWDFRGGVRRHSPGCYCIGGRSLSGAGGPLASPMPIC